MMAKKLNDKGEVLMTIDYKVSHGTHRMTVWMPELKGEALEQKVIDLFKECFNQDIDFKAVLKEA